MSEAPDQSSLVRRLRRRMVGIRFVGNGHPIDCPCGLCTEQRTEERLVNPDGPEAADLIERLSSEDGVTEEMLDAAAQSVPIMCGTYGIDREDARAIYLAMLKARKAP